ncbi:MAG: hypothetical protein H6581_05440 [Bacteroidia bacterium]|nr:hypothetical protein [Bacteroidia bacterium]
MKNKLTYAWTVPGTEIASTNHLLLPFLFFLLFSFSFENCYSQEVGLSWDSLSPGSYSINYKTAPMEEINGISVLVTIEADSGANTEISVEVPDSSWLFEAGNTWIETDELASGPTEFIYEISVNRNDDYKYSGEGRLVTLNLASGGISIIAIEDFPGKKKNFPEAFVKVRAGGDVLVVAQSDILGVKTWALDGEVVIQLDEVYSKEVRFNLPEVNSLRIYFLEIHFDNGGREFLKIAY